MGRASKGAGVNKAGSRRTVALSEKSKKLAGPSVTVMLRTARSSITRSGRWRANAVCEGPG